MRTSGRTVVVSGTTSPSQWPACTSSARRSSTGASATILVVACAVAGSVTVLPAVLELLGTKIDRGRIPFLPHVRTESADSRFWPAVVNSVLRRPLLSCMLSASLLVALALPAFWLHVAKPSDESLGARNEPVLATLGRVRAVFPSTAETAIVVATAAPPVARIVAGAATAPSLVTTPWQRSPSLQSASAEVRSITSIRAWRRPSPPASR